MKSLNRLTRAWVEGLLEGRDGRRRPRSPYPGGAEANDWLAGYARGQVLKNFTEETKSDKAAVNDEVLRIRRALGERV